ncbi:MAG TPA: group 1 truncated hemoglobin [Burkholderiaceae bacterium]|jgi:hemoglobin|nr:group 1 truncated hemoglobin [Burkholderiaceae bacterium]
MDAIRSTVRAVARGAAALAFATALPAGAADAPLYERLGGEPVVTRVVAQTIAQVAGDPKLNRSFEGVNLRKVNERLVEQICAATGGGCRYTGEDMKTVHAGLDITEAEFIGMVVALRDALTRNGVSDAARDELLGLLAPMKPDIVTR